MDEELKIKQYSELETVEDATDLELVSVTKVGGLVKLPTSAFATGNVKPLIIRYNNNIIEDDVINA